MYPKSKDEWWKLADDWWPELVNIMTMFLPINEIDMQEDEDHKPIIDDLYPMIYHIEKNKKEKSAKLFKYLQGAWETAPDDPSIHKIPGWDILCDLCSEVDVLENGEH